LQWVLRPVPLPLRAITIRRIAVRHPTAIHPLTTSRPPGRDMRFPSPNWFLAAVAGWALLTAAQAQVIPFQGNFGPGLSPEDSQLLFESVARLNAAEPSQVGRSETWSNPQTKSHGTSTIIRVFHSSGMACHLVRHHIVSGRPPARDYRLTWCRTSTGEWKIKG
jgi:surface antigen